MPDTSDSSVSLGTLPAIGAGVAGVAPIVAALTGKLSEWPLVAALAIVAAVAIVYILAHRPAAAKVGAGLLVFFALAGTAQASEIGTSRALAWATCSLWGLAAIVGLVWIGFTTRIAILRRRLRRAKEAEQATQSVLRALGLGDVIRVKVVLLVFLLAGTAHAQVGPARYTPEPLVVADAAAQQSAAALPASAAAGLIPSTYTTSANAGPVRDGATQQLPPAALSADPCFACAQRVGNVIAPGKPWPVWATVVLSVVGTALSTAKALHMAGVLH